MSLSASPFTQTGVHHSSFNCSWLPPLLLGFPQHYGNHALFLDEKVRTSSIYHTYLIEMSLIDCLILDWNILSVWFCRIPWSVLSYMVFEILFRQTLDHSLKVSSSSVIAAPHTGHRILLLAEHCYHQSFHNQVLRQSHFLKTAKKIK